MENSLSPLLPAFNLLWKAALKEHSQRTVITCNGNSHSEVPKQPSLPEVSVSSPNMQNQNILSNEESNNESNSNTTNEARVVVCTLDGDQGAKFIRQIIYEGTQKSEWSRAEDLFVDWLNCERQSQHAERMDVTIYFCHFPVNTCSYGLCLWLQNLRQEGKEVSVRMKIASMGSLVSRYLNGDSATTQRGQCGYHEAQETIGALKKLANMDVVVEPISADDWVKLMSLLTDRASLQALDHQQTPSAQCLVKILHNAL